MDNFAVTPSTYGTGTILNGTICEISNLSALQYHLVEEIDFYMNKLD